MNQELSTLQRHNDTLAPVPAGGVEIAQSRVAQEVQAAMVVAKKFPREEDVALRRIEKACCRPGLAEKSQYHFPRGREEISGPTIRLAEVLAQAWGNIDYGTIEIEQRDGESLMMAYCWDLETNVRSTMLFTVPHIRERKGKTGLEQIALDGARDIYEMTANMGARRKRACILSVIPIDVQETALDLCNKTLTADFTDEKRDKMIEAFQTAFGVTAQQLEVFIGKVTKKFDGGTYVRLRRVYETLQDGFAQVADFFPPPAETNGKPRSKFGFTDKKEKADATKESETEKETKTIKEALDAKAQDAKAKVNEAREKKAKGKKTAKAPEPEPEPGPLNDDEEDALPRPELVTPEIAVDPNRSTAYGKLGCTKCHRTFDQVSQMNDRYYCPYCGTGRPIMTDSYEGDDLLTLAESTADPDEAPTQAEPEPNKWRCDKGHIFGETEIRPGTRTPHGLCPECLSSKIEPVAV